MDEALSRLVAKVAAFVIHDPEMQAAFKVLFPQLPIVAEPGPRGWTVVGGARDHPWCRDQRGLPRMIASALSVVVPPCPAWCTTGPHLPEVMDRGALSVLHGREVGEVEVVQVHEFSADGLIAADEVFLTVCGDAMSPEQAASFARDLLVATRLWARGNNEAQLCDYS